MSSTTTKWLGRIFIAVLLLGLAGSGYGLYRLDTERKALRQEITSLNNRNALLQKKYNEQKAVTETVRREKQEVESKARDTEFQLAKREEEYKKLETTIASHEQELTEMRGSYEGTIAAHKERFDSLRSSYDNLREESNRIILEKNQQITALTGEKESLDASLKQESFQNKRCREHNGRFATLTEELIKLYENKGLIKSMGQIEPFTQLKKVEIEKICQEYKDKIDESTLH